MLINLRTVFPILVLILMLITSYLTNVQNPVFFIIRISAQN